MIKHGKIFQLQTHGRPNSHLQPIIKFITKGVADSREKIVLQPQVCDVKGAKRHNGQQCVIAKAFNRTHKPQAVAIGRALAFAVFDGLAIRFTMPPASRRMVEEFDQRGRARIAPIHLNPVNPTWRLGNMRKVPAGKKNGSAPQRRYKKIGVRATRLRLLTSESS